MIIALAVYSGFSTALVLIFTYGIANLAKTVAKQALLIRSWEEARNAKADKAWGTDKEGRSDTNR